MDKPSAPTPPDFVGAAQATGQGNVQASIANALLSQKNQQTPFGNLSYSQTGKTTIPGTARAAIPGTQGTWVPGAYSGGDQRSPGGGNYIAGHFQGGTPATPAVPGTPSQDIPQFTSTSTLDPRLQGGLDQIMNQVGPALSQPLNFPDSSQAYDQKVADALYGRAKSYLDPQWQQGENQTRSRLANQGFSAGSEGYTSGIRDFNTSKEQAYQNARDSAVAQGTAAGHTQQQQDISNMLMKRGIPLQELSAIRTGASPQFGGTPAQGIGGPDLLGAAAQQGQAGNQTYNANVGAYNAQTQGLYGLGTAGLMASLMGGAGGTAAASTVSPALLAALLP